VTVNLVNKDQLDILATLRESVIEDKAGLEADMQRLKKQIRDLNDKNRMQLEQVNVLLLEKVNMQNEGIGQREKMLRRERDFGSVKYINLLKSTDTTSKAIYVLHSRAKMYLKTSSRAFSHCTKTI
jgi:hypothetical protein